MRPIPSQAAQQLGVFTRRQALQAGWSADQLKRAVAAGRLSRPRRGTYATVGCTESPHELGRQWLAQRGVAAALQIPAATVSHGTAVAVHGLPLLHTPTTPCVTLPPPLRSREAALHVHRQPIPSWQLGGQLNVAVTSVARSCIDLTRECGLAAGVVSADAAIHNGLCTAADLEAVYATCRGRAGLASGRGLLDLVDGHSESPLESISRLAMRSLRPAPRTQVALYSPIGQFLARVDFYWDGLGVVGEADGRVKYTDQELWREKRRQERLAEHGLVIERWGWAEAMNPAVLLAKLQAVLSRALRLRTAGLQVTAAVAP